MNNFDSLRGEAKRRSQPGPPKEQFPRGRCIVAGVLLPSLLLTKFYSSNGPVSKEGEAVSKGGGADWRGSLPLVYTNYKRAPRRSDKVRALRIMARHYRTFSMSMDGGFEEQLAVLRHEHEERTALISSAPAASSTTDSKQYGLGLMPW